MIKEVFLGLPIFVVIYYYIKVERKCAEIKRLNPHAHIIKRYLPKSDLWVILNILPDWVQSHPYRWTSMPNNFQYKKDRVVFEVLPEIVRFIVADKDLIEEIFNRKTVFVKPVEQYQVLDVFGRNVVTTEGIDWKRHRKVTAPHFGERNNELVCEVTKQSMFEMFDEWAKNDSSRDLSKAAYEIAMCVISGAAFGIKLPWNEANLEIPKGHKSHFKGALHLMSTSLFKYISIPESMRKFPIKVIQDVVADIEDFEKYIYELLDEAKQNTTETKYNLLYALANDSENNLDLKETLGNLFIILFAGHETTAGTLAFAFAQLAINQGIQDRLYEEIQQVLGSKIVQYDDLKSMPFVLAIMYETLRLYAPVEIVPKIVRETTKVGSYILPPDTAANIHCFGANYDPAIWGSDVFEFNPSRWFIDPECAKSAQVTQNNPHSLKGYLHSNRYAFTSFSDGPRACLGRRFAEVEFMTCILTLVQKFELQVPDGVSKASLLEGSKTITFRPKNPIILDVINRSD